MTNAEVIMEGQLRECYGRVVYSHKTHEKCADILMRNHENIKLAHISFSVLITGGIVTTLLSDSKVGAIISAVLSTIVLFLNTYTKNYDLGELAQKHRQAAADLWVIREEYLSLLTDVRICDVPLDVIRARRDELMKKLHAAYTGAPGTNLKAYTAAQKALQQKEDLTFTEDEIDAFLPKELKRK